MAKSPKRIKPPAPMRTINADDMLSIGADLNSVLLETESDDVIMPRSRLETILEAIELSIGVLTVLNARGLFASSPRKTGSSRPKAKKA